jgi:hypothetical protein
MLDIGCWILDVGELREGRGVVKNEKMKKQKNARRKMMARNCLCGQIACLPYLSPCAMAGRLRPEEPASQ